VRFRELRRRFDDGRNDPRNIRRPGPARQDMRRQPADARGFQTRPVPAKTPTNTTKRPNF
jgi:hypothetical protein